MMARLTPGHKKPVTLASNDFILKTNLKLCFGFVASLQTHSNLSIQIPHLNDHYANFRLERERSIKKVFSPTFYTVYALETKKMGKLQQYSEEKEHLALGPRM